MNSRSGELIIAILVGLAVLTGGFAILTGQHNAIVAGGRAGVCYVGVNIAALRGGTMEAIKENPGKSASIVAAATALGAAVKMMGDQSQDSGKHITITGDDNTVVIDGDATVTKTRTTTRNQ